MYSSLKDWINVPISIKPFKKRTGTGGKVFDETFETSCYPHAELKVIRNYNSEEVVSNTQLYIDGSIPVKAQDVVIFESQEHDVQSVGTFYRNGVPDIRVVYI